MQYNNDDFNFCGANEEPRAPYDDYDLEECFSESGIFQEVIADDENSQGEVQSIAVDDPELVRILKQAFILELPEDDTASLSLSLTGAVELLKSETVRRFLNSKDILTLQKALPSHAQIYLLEQAIKDKRAFAYDAGNSTAQNFLQSWLYKIGSRFSPEQGPQNFLRVIPNDVYAEALKLEKAVCKLKIKEECERVPRPATTAQAYLMSPLAPDYVKNIIGSNELAFSEAVKTIGIISTAKQNKAVAHLDRQALIFYVTLMRICVKYALSSKDPLAYLRYRMTNALDNEKRRLKKIRVRCENFCNEILHISDLKNISEEQLQDKLMHIDVSTLGASTRRTAENLLKALRHKIHYENLGRKQREAFFKSLSDDVSQSLLFLQSLRGEVQIIESEEVQSKEELAKELQAQEVASRTISTKAQELYEILQILKRRGFFTEELALIKSLRTGAPFMIPNCYGQYMRCRAERESLQRRIVRILNAYK